MRTVEIAIFAHNEARSIQRCLAAMPSSSAGLSIKIHVLANGCTDDTVKISRQLAGGNPNIEVHDIKMGDKCNAWNLFVHELGGDADLYVFHDGDCWVGDGAIKALLAASIANPHANAINAVPGVGRNAQSWRRELIDQHGLAGNLYALSPGFVERLRASDVHLPTGMVGEDSLIGALAKWNLDPTQDWQNDLVHPCADARFHYVPLKPYSLSDMRQQYGRLVRYAMRKFELDMLRPGLKADGIAAIPDTIDKLYGAMLHVCRLSWRGYRTLFAWVALRRIERRAREFARSQAG